MGRHYVDQLEDITTILQNLYLNFQQICPISWLLGCNGILIATDFKYSCYSQIVTQIVTAYPGQNMILLLTLQLLR